MATDVHSSQADQARQVAARAQQEQAELRRQLMIQFNQILQTRESARGLIVNQQGSDLVKQGTEAAVQTREGL